MPSIHEKGTVVVLETFCSEKAYEIEISIINSSDSDILFPSYTFTLPVEVHMEVDVGKRYMQARRRVADG
ncbi:hypothetical protein KDI_17260 [Dictyobacter arantiisoli]|uniref:Uncharacterized protein n=1 Tax=Dictyobacter arantiisoli TaxID=2014874 RepID=A0A5A5T9R7_9CHLR|nr:hypothetical protein KDI_17260 [Dictyobacter arantiisoli]